MKGNCKAYRRLAIALLLSLPSLASALQTDKDQATYIEADSVDIDDRKGISIYKGHVELTQGSIRLNAAKIVVTQKQSSSDHIVATGKPVTFQQKTDGNKGMVKGRSSKVEYSVDSEIIHMIGKAVLTQGRDTFKSDRITYDRAKAIVKAGASAKGKQRVRVTIGGKSSKK